MNWDGFPTPARAGEIPFCMVDGEFCCAHPDRPISLFTNVTKSHPKINVSRDFHHHTRDEGVSMYIEVEDNLLKRITSVWYKQGFVEALQVATDPTINRDYPQIAVIASYALKVTNALKRFRHFLQPHLEEQGRKVITNYSHTRNWTNSPVRCLAWHPQVTKLAVATADDSVRIYSPDSTVVSVLKCNAQKSVSSLSWRPYAAGELAVGCEKGVIVWTVDPNSTFTKPSSSHANLLANGSSGAVTCVCWSPRGDILVSCSAADGALLVWDVDLETCVPLRRLTGGGVAFSVFSSDSNSLFSATTSLVFRVWETKGAWKLQRWNTRGGRVLAACCSPDLVWLFAVQGETLLYMLNAKADPILGNKTSSAIPVLDLSRTEWCGMLVGGTVLDMAWDPTGQYLAIIYHETGAVTIFNTIFQVVRLDILPCCMVTGMDEEVANCISFQQNFSRGACLSIAWSSGRIQHFPIIFTDARA